MGLDVLHPRRRPEPGSALPSTPGGTVPLPPHSPPDEPPPPLGPGSRVHREAVVAFDGRAVGYTVTLAQDVPHDAEPVHALDCLGGTGRAGSGRSQQPPAIDPADLLALHESYLTLDLPNLVADRHAFLPATPQMLDGALPRGASTGRVVLDLPLGFEHEPGAVRRAARLHAMGVALCLPGYRGSKDQNALLGLLAFVTIHRALLGAPSDLGQVDRPTPALADVVSRVHAVGARVLAEDLDPLTAARSRVAGVDALRGAATPPVTETAPRVLRAGQLQCLAVMHLLHQPQVELAKVSQVIDTDPVLTVRVLHLVNSGAFGLSRGIDTVGQAVVLLGPRELLTLVATLALEARPGAMDSLWRILARALTCEAVSDAGAGYTVGLLSALVEELGVPMEAVLETVGVSPGLNAALLTHDGPLGRVLAAVLAHERRDYCGVLSLGFAPMRVSDAYVRSLANALATARAVSPA